MSSLYLKDAYSAKVTPQSESIPGREAEMVPNSAGGFTFPVDDWTRLDRFLVLGSEGGSYYATERKLTRENAEAVSRCIKADGQRVVAKIVEVSHAGRAPKNDPALFALAMCASFVDTEAIKELAAMKPDLEGLDASLFAEQARDLRKRIYRAVETRRAALNALPQVARIGTHLFHFIAFVEGFRGWGRALRRAVAKWYADRPVDDLALQVIKYRQRDGWTHRDLLRLSHREGLPNEKIGLYDWILGHDEYEDVPGLITDFAVLQAVEVLKPGVPELIRQAKLPREAVPTQLLNEVRIWEALLDEPMPMTAMIRNLGKMSQVGLLKPFEEHVGKVVSRLLDEEALKRARVHPIQLLMALKTYTQGHGEKGKLQWTAVPQIVDALDKSFYKAFQNVVPTNKRLLLALDVSGSMGSGSVAGTSLTPREGAAAMALVTAATEPNYHIVGFTAPVGNRGLYYGREAAITPLSITPRQRLDDVVNYTASLSFGGTDCAQPMLYALANNLSVDAFCVYTDSETWAGNIHPIQALQQYRAKTGIAAKLVVVGMVSNGFSIADPNDAGMMDVCGFDTAVPQVMADFIRA